MAKGRSETKPQENRGGPARGSDSLLPWATLAGLVVIIILGWLNYREMSEMRRGLDARFDQLGDRVDGLGTKVDSVAAAARQRPTGPDPNRVYTIKTDAAPAKGPAGAPVTIAEFSDFQ